MDEYAEQGFRLTLRQLFYQFVARGWLKNEFANYKMLGVLITRGRNAGVIDWDSIYDFTREVVRVESWECAESSLRSALDTFHVDHWEGQKELPEVWIEKDALHGVFSPVCSELDVPLFSTRGFPSVSSVWEAAQRFLYRFQKFDQLTTVLHFGDHDPSGVDMTRDIAARLAMYGAKVEVRRVALTKKQAKQHKCPPMMTKPADARTKKYDEKHGGECWELDGLPPSVLVDLVKQEVPKFRADKLYRRRLKFQDQQRKILAAAVERFDDVVAALDLRG